MDLPTILDWVTDYAVLIVFAWLALENTLFLGFIAPGLTVLVVVGLLIQTGDVRPVPVLLAALAGTYLGDNVNYLVGRWGLRRFGWIRRILDDNDDARRFIDRYPRVIYIFFHFPVYLRTAFPLTLGSMRYPFRTWLWIDLAAAPLFVAAFTGLGYGLARYVLQVNDLVTAVREVARTGNGIILVFSLLFAYGTLKLPPPPGGARPHTPFPRRPNGPGAVESVISTALHDEHSKIWPPPRITLRRCRLRCCHNRMYQVRCASPT